MMTIAEARHLGQSKLGIDQTLFKKCQQAAQEMGVRAQDMGPMTLAIGVMGIAKVDKEEVHDELSMALELVAKAEKSFKLELKARSN